MAKTQKNKKTEYHLGLLKAKLVKSYRLNIEANYIKLKVKFKNLKQTVLRLKDLEMLE